MRADAGSCGSQGRLLVSGAALEPSSFRGRHGGPTPSLLDTFDWLPILSSPPVPSLKRFSSLPHFLPLFPTLLSVVSFLVPWGSISAAAGNARVQLVSQESGVGGSEKRAGRQASPLRLRKGGAVQMWGVQIELHPRTPGFSLSLGSMVPCALGQVACPLWASLCLSVYREGDHSAVCFRGRSLSGSRHRYLHFYQAPPWSFRIKAVPAQFWLEF